jgi:hypothetical protein
LISFLHIDMKNDSFSSYLKKLWFLFFILIWKMILFQTNLKKVWSFFFVLIWKNNVISNHVWSFMIYIIIYMIFEWRHRFFFLTHRFLKWNIIVFFFDSARLSNHSL